MRTSKKTKPRQASGGFGSATKTLAVLRAFIDRQDQWGVRELAHALEQPISSTHRLLQILRTDGLVDWDPTSQQYALGTEAYRWAAAVGDNFDLLEIGGAVARELASATGENAGLAVLDAQRRRIFYAVEVDGPRSLLARGAVGRTEALDRSAAGWALVDRLPQTPRDAIVAKAGSEMASGLASVRDNGFAWSHADENRETSVIAAPVQGFHGAPGACLVISVPSARASRPEAKKLGAQVRAHAEKLGRRLRMRLLSGSPGGASHPGMAAIARLAGEHLPELRLVSRESHGRRNLTALQNGEAAYCTAVIDNLESAYLGQPPHDMRHHRLRVVMPLAPLFLHILVRADSPFRNFRDLLGVRISPGERDYATAQAFSVLARLSGAAPKLLARVTARTVYLDYIEAHREFLAGKLDALVSLNSLPNPEYVRIGRRIPVRLIPLDRELISRFVERQPCYSEGQIPRGTYEGNNSTAVPRTSLVLVTSEERPDDEVYELARAIHEGRRRLHLAAPGFAPAPPAVLPRSFSVPLHPGAHRYWARVASPAD